MGVYFFGQFKTNLYICSMENKQWSIPTVGETIKISRKVAMKMKEKYHLIFFPLILDIKKITKLDPKTGEITFVGKMTEKRGKCCMVCNRTLTDEFSLKVGVGSVCRKYLKIDVKSEMDKVDLAKELYLKRIEQIGEFEILVGKKEIKQWNGGTKLVLQHV